MSALYSQSQALPIHSAEVYGWVPTYEAELHAHDGCEICAADEQIQDRAWHAYGIDKNLGRALRSLRKAGLAGLDEKAVGAHYRAHNYRQPAAPQVGRAKMLAAARSIPDGHGRIPKILQAISRMGTLSQSQIVRLFFYPDTSSQDSAEKSAARMLSRMRFSHLIYPVRPEAQRSPETYYALGAWALPLLEECDTQTSPPRALAYREELPIYMLQDQSEAAEMFTHLRAGLYPRNRTNRILEVHGKATPTYMNPASWWGSRSLLFSTPDGKLQYRPDSFATLSMNDGRKKQCQLPMLLEHDEGVLPVEEVAEQLLAYIELSRQGIPQSRFPQHVVEGYHIPLLVSTTTPARAERILARLEDIVDDQARPMIMVTDQQSFIDGAWEADCWRVLGVEDELGMNLAELLLTASRPLTLKGAVHWRSDLDILPEQGLPKKPKAPRWLFT